ncbi:SDR family oxidoreductase [Microbacterium sp. SORGH_AS_0888]|uniref:SDR family NAD(P)-dependent oxidoreductase n=1 Tax=Microbacterium sp. SORGH_AS_0888 TaxID=3041791 RepID=UPI002782B0D0|nr:SDR family oxidoreductase [Microbacterium sp. SORGH_AS_0888]MDQ1129773.1 short-subunit dehydrogenase [Microbacterium sp. SORGH_AS_0888]
MVFLPRRSLITGASSGIGAGFARALAARGSDVVLVARRADRLEALASELTAANGIRAEVLARDLAEPGAGRWLRDVIEGEVDVVVNNAGFGTHGALIATDAERLEREIDLDVRALVDVTRAFLPAMVAARRGAIVNIASTASYQPIPGMAVYGASKTFVRTFSEAVWHEARAHGVKVMALSPGATRTDFFSVAGIEDPSVGGFQAVEQVVATGLAALDRRRTPPSVVSGRANAAVAALTRFIPTRLMAGMAARIVARW